MQGLLEIVIFGIEYCAGLKQCHRQVALISISRGGCVEGCLSAFILCPDIRTSREQCVYRVPVRHLQGYV